MNLLRSLFAATLWLAPLPVIAQTVPPAAPAPQSKAPAHNEAVAPSINKDKKPRSEAQKKNDARMRACGQEWRAAKAANKTGGKTWRDFSIECRRQKKASG